MISIQKEIRTYLPAIFMDETLPREKRNMLRTALFVVVVLVSLLVSILLIRGGVLRGISLREAATHSDVLIGLTLILFSVLVSFYLLAFFYNTLYYRGIKFMLDETRDAQGITYEVAHILSNDNLDVTRGLLSDTLGKRILSRCGVHEDAVRQFIEHPRVNLTVDT
jgi:hypothetical protein